MLLNKERRRSLKAVLVSRPARWPPSIPPESTRQPPQRSQDARSAAGSAPEHRHRRADAAEPPPMGRLAESRAEMTPQERAVVAQSFRARYALSDRRMVADLRRRHRVELLDEIARLTRVARRLQERISTTERRILIMERVATRFERVAELLKDVSGAEPARRAPVTALPQVATSTVLPAAVGATPNTDRE